MGSKQTQGQTCWGTQGPWTFRQMGEKMLSQMDKLASQPERQMDSPMYGKMKTVDEQAAGPREGQADSQPDGRQDTASRPHGSGIRARYLCWRRPSTAGV